TQTTTWFNDEEALVRELRGGARLNHHAPSIQGYADLRELRRGGQGIVNLGLQKSTRRMVAIKIVLDGALASGEARRRFEREIDLVATLRHPHVVRVYDSGETEDGRLYYIMEYIDGLGLDELIPGGQPGASPVLTGRNLLVMFAKICDAVQHAHQQGVIHRDLHAS